MAARCLPSSSAVDWFAGRSIYEEAGKVHRQRRPTPIHPRMKSEISILAFPDFSAPPPPCAFLMFCVRICVELAPLAAVNVRRCGSRDVARGEGVRVCVGGGFIVLARQLSPTPAAARPPAGRHHPWGGGPKGPFFGRCERKHKIYIEKNKKIFFIFGLFF